MSTDTLPYADGAETAVTEHPEIIHEKLEDLDCLWRRFRHLVFFPNGENCILLSCPEITLTAALEEKILPNITVLRGERRPPKHHRLGKLFSKMVESKRSAVISTITDGIETSLLWSAEKT